MLFRSDAADGQAQSEAFLTAALRRMLADYDAYFQQASPGATRFKDRGLSSDTSVYAAFAMDAALIDLKAMGGLEPGRVARVGIVGPGLDFADKQEGYDVYPVQTIQPFAVLDSLSASQQLAAHVDRHVDPHAALQTDYLDNDTAAPLHADRHAGQSVVIFRVGDEWLALPTGVLGEVTAPAPVHSLPHRRHAALIGVAAVREIGRAHV